MNYFKDSLKMTYSIRESNQDDKNLIHDFNKELESQGISFRLPAPSFKIVAYRRFYFRT